MIKPNNETWMNSIQFKHVNATHCVRLCTEWFLAAYKYKYAHRNYWVIIRCRFKCDVQFEIAICKTERFLCRAAQSDQCVFCCFVVQIQSSGGLHNIASFDMYNCVLLNDSSVKFMYKLFHYSDCTPEKKYSKPTKQCTKLDKDFFVYSFIVHIHN